MQADFDLAKLQKKNKDANNLEFNEDHHAFRLVPDDDLEQQVLSRMVEGSSKGKTVTLSKIDHESAVHEFLSRDKGEWEVIFTIHKRERIPDLNKPFTPVSILIDHNYSKLQPIVLLKEVSFEDYKEYVLETNRQEQFRFDPNDYRYFEVASD